MFLCGLEDAVIPVNVVIQSDQFLHLGSVGQGARTVELEGNDRIGDKVGGDGFRGGLLGGGLVIAQLNQGKGIGQGNGLIFFPADFLALLLHFGRCGILLDLTGQAVCSGGGHFERGVNLFAFTGGG